jgi:hypothetical protein
VKKEAFSVKNEAFPVKNEAFPAKWPPMLYEFPRNLACSKPKGQATLEPRFSWCLLANNKSMLVQPTRLSQVNHVTNQIGADMNNQTYVVKGIYVEYHAPMDWCC